MVLQAYIRPHTIQPPAGTDNTAQYAYLLFQHHTHLALRPSSFLPACLGLLEQTYRLDIHPEKQRQYRDRPSFQDGERGALPVEH